MKKIIVIGNGMVSYKFCEKMTADSSHNSCEITVLGEEPRPAYDRVHLSEFFSSASAADLELASANWYADRGISLKCGELVTSIDRSNKQVLTLNKARYEYDQLVIATGSSPFVPPIQGVEKQGVFVYRTIEDLEAMMAYGEKLKRGGKRTAAVLGGGLLGLEAAKAVKDMNLDVKVIEFASRLMPRQLDEAGASLLRRSIESMGIDIYLSKNTREILGDQVISGLLFEDGSQFDADMLVISAGIRPRDELGIAAGLEMGLRGGIVVNDTMRSSDPDIFAIGEVASYQGNTYGLVAPGYDMASVAADQILGGDSRMIAEVDMSTQLKLIGVEVASFGDSLGEIAHCQSIVFEDNIAGVYKRVNIDPEENILLGGILVGDSSDYNMLLQIMKNRMALPAQPEDLILGERGQTGGGSRLGDLPDSALICSCEAVSKGLLTEAITDQGCESLDAIKLCTKAGTGCGGCVPMVKDLLTETLQSMGKDVKKVICEHFPFSRQELYDLIRVKELRSYDEALDKLGMGDGCEVCKPAIASIFAGIYNETATVQETIQDTNDRYLANIQRNGSYSVVPRVPGGEITPEKLIALGTIAKKYDLYTKITGGQRIDMFGARVNELPDIWEELIDAGFESGHAYGKALRTVKSCVGSTWCRYGMHDSVSFAIEIENRYRGIRAPHKLKGGVSGCIRECAEARGKDFGIIATEAGWNLYVCGNGGAKPKHAILLASDISNEECIRYLDRFLMFYIKTADPLVRTAPWLEKLEGGMDYLRSIVVEDSLGIGEDLEREMQFMIDTYNCEWAEVVANPDLRKRFKHFANVEEGDSNMNWVPLRGQKMPAPWK